ncbi:MAG: ribonuclease III [Candidatus Eremiobacteraeota bacterium]|nr:ribonuclease III [Candidatus Eremiobacteraeota bacterium]
MPGENRRRRLRALLKLAGVTTEDFAAIDAAFVHESAAKERGGTSNERLEFLGDSVLGLIVTHWAFTEYPADDQGRLTKAKAAIVNDNALAVSARRLGFSELLELGAGERASGGAERVSILADSFEAFIAVLYTQFGFDAARRFILKEHVAHTEHSHDATRDPKTMLQEYTQGHLACMPEYEEEGEGPAHLPRFTSFVRVKGELLGTGTGHSKKAAQQEAAAQALQALQAREPDTSTQE